MARLSKIVLVVPKYSKRQEFSVDHAERLLAMGTEANGGWVIPEYSKYEYIKGYGIKRRPDKADSEKAE